MDTRARKDIPEPIVPGLLPDEPRQGGFGPRTSGEWSSRPYRHPAAGWGAAKSVAHVVEESMNPTSVPYILLQMNHPKKGFDCPGCAWPDDQKGLRLDVCENGIKHASWEMDRTLADRDFFAAHTVAELSTWTDTELENAGRLTEPMTYDPASDKYVPISWESAFQLIGEQLRALESPDEASFYTSGRLSNEGSFMYQLFAREFGTNNLPDCSNMCHEASGRGLNASIATGKGTADLGDWEQADAIFILGVNAASNAPRMLTTLQEAVARGAQVVHVNTLVEAAAGRTIVPHDFVDMALFHASRVGTLDLQVRPGGDMAMLRAMAKHLFEATAYDPHAIDEEFLATYTEGAAEYRALVEATPWDELVEQSGLTIDELRRAGEIYRTSPKTVITWCLGVSQHEHGVDAVREIVNLLLLRGNIGRPGTGPSPVRGHSNVQGNRTCGIDHRPSEGLLERLDAEFGIHSPRHHGLETVGTVLGLERGEIKVFIGMGGNFVLAAPATDITARGMTQCELTAHVSTKLNRSHLVHGRRALILPCIPRSERDMQATGRQFVSCEDAMAWVQLTAGKRAPSSPHLRSEPAIIAGIAKATMPDTVVDWDAMVADYDVIRDHMSRVLEGFEGFNELVRRPLGFRIPQPARERVFRTPSGKAEFSHAELFNVIPDDPDQLVLQTMRSHDQWNTTIYSANDRYRGIKHLRELILMHRDDLAARGISPGDPVEIVAYSKDGSTRSVRGFRAVEYDTPRGSAAGYMPELNNLIGPADWSEQSDQPLMKSLRVKVSPLARHTEREQAIGARATSEQVV